VILESIGERVSNTEKRAYRSPKREAKAAETRARIVAAAGACFTEFGYAGTTMQSIADRADVSVETVYANGPKRQLLVAAFETAFAGDEGRQPLGERPDAREILELPDRDQLIETGVRFIATANARSAGLWRAFRSAANSDPEVQEVMDDLVQRRSIDFANNVAALAALGPVASADHARLATAMTFLMSHEGYELMVELGGWNIDEYVAWVTSAIKMSVVQ
jgi:AcrR family transcriptional regulator